MGKIESKFDLRVKRGINCKIKTDIICPICNQLLKGNTTYSQLNNHLKACEYHLMIKNEKMATDSKSNKNVVSQNLNDMIDENYLNKVYVQSKKGDFINSEPHRTTLKKSLNTSDISNENTINDFQLVIDYNNTKNPDLYEEKLKIEGKKEQLIDKYENMSRFLKNKKNLMNYDFNIECNNYKEVFHAIKNCNIYYDNNFILLKKNNTSPPSKKPRILNFNKILNKYCEIMIKNKKFKVEDDTLFFAFNNAKVDFEMIGIILSILFIYPDIKLKYKLPLILCKIIVNQRLELNDIKYVNNVLYDNLYKIEKDKNINDRGLVYYYEGDELLIDGKNIKVNNENVCDYIEKIVNYQIRKYKNEINIIKSNLFQFVPKKYIFYFKGEEIYQIINRSL